eukprot:352893-Chlamydomonas_euryale.AAC.6
MQVSTKAKRDPAPEPPRVADHVLLVLGPNHQPEPWSYKNVLLCDRMHSYCKQERHPTALGGSEVCRKPTCHKSDSIKAKHNEHAFYKAR